MTAQERTQLINRLQKRHPHTRRQRSYHGADRYSVQFFCKETGTLVADYDVSDGMNKSSVWQDGYGKKYLVAPDGSVS